MDQFIEFISEIMQVDKVEIKPETRRGSLPEWDSLMHLRLMTQIEEHYGVEIPIEHIAEIMTVKDFYKYIKTEN